MTDLLTTSNSSEAWPDLSVVQQWFQAVVTDPAGISAGLRSDDALELAPMTRDDLEYMVTRSDKVSARERLAIYGNAYFARLMECLGDSYPVLKRVLGDEAFNGFAFNYLQRYPSQSYTLGHLGARFSQYLGETRPDASDTTLSDGERPLGWPDFLIDLANLEWIIGQVFDGPGIEGKAILKAEQLQDIKPEQWPSARLNPVPCLQLIAMRFPLNEFYTLARKAPEEEEIPFPSPVDSYVAITRRDYVVRRHELTHAQYVLLEALSRGDVLGDAIEEAAACSDLGDQEFAEALQEWFQYWTSQQFFASVTL
ncbi:MAG: DNA-binding domain-containing protein [Candidatus Hydrogenedentes bacterium]|nr:DNA-binding domain-containing protein [Candidatus Hydrogenedentota bacterium]